MDMNRETAINRAEDFFDTDAFFRMLAQWIALDTGSRANDRKPQMMAYLEQIMVPYLTPMGFGCRTVENPTDPCAPFLIARRIEEEQLPTVLIYGHGDTVPAMAADWAPGLSPWS